MSDEDWRDMKYNDGEPDGKATCPYCGRRMKPSNHGGLVYCGFCHRKMPWIDLNDDDTPIKELFKSTSRRTSHDGKKGKVHSQEPDPLREPEAGRAEGDGRDG